MVDQDGDNTGSAGVMGSVGEAVDGNINTNGFVVQSENGRTANGNFAGSSGESFQTANGNIAGSSRESFRTYKRRKRAQAVEDVRSSGDLAGQIEEKLTKGLWDVDNECCSAHAGVAGTGMHVGMTFSYDPSLKHLRNVVLEHICKSLKGEGGLEECIRDALVHPSENGCTSAVKESVHSCEDGKKCSSPSGRLHDRIQNACNGIEGAILDSSINETNNWIVTERCKRTFSDVIMSEKFALLCNMLLENFQGMKADKLFDISLMNSRIKEGAYEKSPVLFFLDIQQIWTKLQKVGTDIVALAKDLSEKSRTMYHKQIGGLMRAASDDGAIEFVTQESDMHAKVEQTDACGIYKVCTCKRCGGKADGRDCLVCDSCEEMYHVACIEPPIKESPQRSWYCASCTAKGIESPHDNCVVCDRLNAPRSLVHDGVDELSNAETLMELEESSNGLTDDDTNVAKGGKVITHCNVCRMDIKNGEKLKICGHAFCPHKFYHARCLTSKQLDSYGPQWYCPSCLCRVCLADRDDDKIVLCDGCDHAYHIYCMQPPRSTVPRGKWFCRKCDAEIRCIRKAKRTYENLQRRLTKRPGEGKTPHVEKGEKEEALEKSGGVDMLLNAARTLNYEEDLAARRVKI
ncbi:PHD finger protein EHD3-like isoform X2 [Coffea arabica]|nr:PHD finger protein EHD3-like isoform X2 [Coffea arabica]